MSVLVVVTNHNIFENDAVKIFGTVNVHGSALRGRNQYFIVFLQPLLIDGNFDGVSAESIKGINEHDIPDLWLIAVAEHSLKFRPMVVCSRHSTVNVGVYDFQIVSFRKFIADTQLSFNGLLGLPFARISRMAVFDAVFKHADIRVSFLTDAGDDEIFLGDKTDTGQFVVSEFIESGNGVNNFLHLEQPPNFVFAFFRRRRRSIGR